MRNVMITTIGEDYVLAAQAKGLPSHRVVLTYAARNALLPQLQGFGLALGFVVSGAIIMEIVFSYPGIGLLLVNAVTSNDYPLMQAIFLVITFAVLLANLIVDLLIVVVDPRVRAREVADDRCYAGQHRPGHPRRGAPKLGRWRRLPLKAKAARSCSGLFVLAAIIGPFVTPYDPSFQNPSLSLSLHAPDAAHLLGTTQSGQDVLSQLLVGHPADARAGAAGRRDRHRAVGHRRRDRRRPRRAVGRSALA